MLINKIVKLTLTLSVNKIDTIGGYYRVRGWLAKYKLTITLSPKFF